MRIFSVLDLLALVFMGWFGWTQIVVPFAKGTKLFPAFRARTKLEEELVEIREERDVLELEKRVESERKNLNRVRNVKAVNDEEKESDKK